MRVCTADGAASCWFLCPGCGLLTVKERLSVDLIGQLRYIGADVTVWDLPRERVDLTGPLTHDHLAAFHRLLADDAQLAERVRRLG